MTIYILMYSQDGVETVIGAYKSEQGAKFGMAHDRQTAHKGALSYAYDIIQRELEE